MSTSILTTIKMMLGIQEDYTHFDQDIIVNINTAFSTLTQLGVGPVDGFTISDSAAEWTDFIDDKRLESIKTYIYLKVRLVFDPPSSSSVADSYSRTLSELEWRINAYVDPISKEGFE